VTLPFLGAIERALDAPANREGFSAYVADRLSAGK
jgi:hypothetical protein